MAMRETKLIDYSENIIKIKQYTRALEEALMRQDMDYALELTLGITVESRLLGQNLKLLNDNNGIPYQVELQQS
jgi:hypothetical protein